MDFRPVIAGPLDVLVCDACGLGGLAHSAYPTAIGEFFEDKAYVERTLPVHYVQAPGADAPVPAPEHQVDILVNQGQEVRGVLDIGCFDGRLLRAFQSRYPDAKLVGYDVSPHNSSFFGDGLEYVTGGLATIEGAFDIITMSHSLQYEPDLPNLFSHIERLLAPQGVVLLQVPDVAKKPTGLVLADVHHHFTAPSLANLAVINRLVPEIVSDTGFRRDAVVIARRGAHKPAMVDGGAAALADSVKTLQNLADEVASLSDQGPWNILGTTIDAAFVFQLLGKQAADFIDETPGASEITFQNRTVRHPSSLVGGEKTLMPLGLKAGDILKRFEAEYQGTFILL